MLNIENPPKADRLAGKKFYILISILILTSDQVYSQVSLQWDKRHDPGIQAANWLAANYMCLASDDEGSVYITGPSHNFTTGGDIITIKYNSLGEEIWINRFDGSFGSTFRNDLPRALAVDHNNNVIVAGIVTVVEGPPHSEAIVIKYAANGDTLWTRRYLDSLCNSTFFSDIVLDSLNNIYVAGHTNYCSFGNYGITIKYDEDGNIIWQSRYDFPDYACDDKICIDPAENFCYVAYCVSDFTRVTKYDVIYGDSSWSRILPSDHLSALITTDNLGNPLVAIVTSDYKLFKLAPNGDQLWSVFYSAGVNSNDRVRDLKIDDDNNVYMTGQCELSNHDLIWSTVKYDASGQEKWSSDFNNGVPYYINEKPCGLEIDRFGDIYVGGYTEENTNVSNDYLLIKYDGETGTMLDDFFYYNYSGNHPGDWANAMTMDTSGNIFITGMMWHDSLAYFGFGTIMLSPIENASTLTLEKEGLNKAISDLQTTSDTIVVNTGLKKTTDYSVINVKIIIDSVYHTNDSDLEFYLTHEGVTDTLIFCVGGDGNNFTGTTLDDPSPLLLSEGTAPFTGTFKPHSSLSVFIGLDPNGEWILKVYDNTTGNTGTLQAWKLQLQMSLPTGVEPITNNIPNGFSLVQNFPNPFNPTTTLSFIIGHSSFVTLKVYDILGREVATLIDEYKPAGTYEMKFDATYLPSGVYFYQIKTENYLETKKMIYLK